jgi:predicted RNase H-like HicB family nuclease
LQFVLGSTPKPFGVGFGVSPKRTLIRIPSVLLLGPVLNYCERMRLGLVVEYDSEAKRWAAFFPELPGCASAGDTEDQAIQNAKQALELWFEPTPASRRNELYFSERGKK